jgi:DNA modification methylase
VVAVADPIPAADTLSVWATAQATGPVQRRGRYVRESVKHPARMLPAIAAHAVQAYTRPGDLVLDPMCGIGTTLVEAVHAGRDALGIEYESRWSDIADANLTHAHHQGATGRGSVIRGDATRILSLVPAALAGQVALVVTSPPYGPTVHGLVRPGAGGVAKFANAYNDGTDKGNLAYRDLTGLADGFAQILHGCATLLKPGGTVVVTARPWRKHGHLVDLPSAVIESTNSTEPK